MTCRRMGWPSGGRAANAKSVLESVCLLLPAELWTYSEIWIFSGEFFLVANHVSTIGISSSWLMIRTFGVIYKDMGTQLTFAEGVFGSGFLRQRHDTREIGIFSSCRHLNWPSGGRTANAWFRVRAWNSKMARWSRFWRKIGILLTHQHMS